MVNLKTKTETRGLQNVEKLYIKLAIMSYMICYLCKNLQELNLSYVFLKHCLKNSGLLDYI